VEALRLVSRVIVGVVLVSAFTAKVLNFRWFVDVLASYKLWPRALSAPIAALVILLEVSVGGALLGGGWFGSAWLAAALFMLLQRLSRSIWQEENSTRSVAVSGHRRALKLVGACW